MDRFNEEIYGKVLWECYRSKVYIVTLSLMYVLLGAAHDQFMFHNFLSYYHVNMLQNLGNDAEQESCE